MFSETSCPTVSFLSYLMGFEIMSPQTYERKLTAILSADVAGYSRLMGEDEDLTINTLTGHREMMTALIEKHKGRVVDSPGHYCG